MKNVENIYPLSPMQQGMLFHTLYAPESNVYLVQWIFTLQGDLNVSLFKEVWQRVIEKHAILRTCFVWEDVDEPVQIVRQQVTLPWEEFDWRERSFPPQKEQIEEYIRADRQQGFVLSRAPVMRLSLIRLADDNYKFICSLHHILVDGWSTAILFDEVFSLYESLCQGREPQLTPTRPYADYIFWLQKQDLSAAERFWRNTLKGFTAPTELPLGLGHDLGQGQEEHTEQRVLLSQNSTAALQSFARRHKLTINTLVQGAWALLCSRYAGEEDVVFGGVVNGRPTGLIGADSMVGLFINTLPVRVKVCNQDLVLPWLEKLQMQQAEQRQYDYSPLLAVQQWSEVAPASPLFENILLFQNYPVTSSYKSNNKSLQIERERYIARTNYPLTMAASLRKQLSLKASYDRLRLDDNKIARMLRHFEVLLEGMAANPGCRISELPMLPESERNQLLTGWNQTSSELPKQRIQQLFETQVERTPDAIAVVFEGQRLTYAELNRRANQLAHYLRVRGVGPDVIVGLSLKRSLEMVVGVLAVLKAGGAYLALDPEYPAERLSFMFRDAGVKVLLTHDRLRQRVPEQGAETISLDSEREAIARQSDRNPVAHGDGENLAYVIYTSGSTGQPKGIGMTQRALSNLLSWQLERAGLLPALKTLQFASLSFDVSFQEIFSTWCSGGTLVLISEELRRDVPALLSFLYNQGIERIFVPFMYLQYLAEVFQLGGSAPKHLREILVAGEQLEITPQIKLFCSHLKDCTLHNHYGPSESHVVTAYTLSGPDDWPMLPPIGRPISNTQIYILDTNVDPVPIGVPGEVYIGGISVSRGYLNRPDLTAEKFLPDPFRREPGARVYRTGDLARYRSDGNIEFLGRIDNQVKIRGFRIEPGEIEMRLAPHPSVREVVVAAREDVKGERELVAYVVPVFENNKELARELRTYLKERLPDYMIPAAFVMMETLPLTPSGKIDRQALPSTYLKNTDAGDRYEGARNPVEQKLVEIWSAVLKREPIGIRDNFFDLGGHSMLAVRLMSEIEKQFDQKIPLVSLFQNATIAALAHILRRNVSSLSWPTVVEIQRGTSNPPLFCVSVPNVNALGYRSLARYLGPDQSVFGLQAQYPTDIIDEHSREAVDRVATEYLEALRAVQPAGPYQFVGLCRGAHIAYELARRLEQEGQHVALLGILDTWVIENTFGYFWYVEQYTHRLAWLTRQSLRNQVSFIKKKAQETLTRLTDRVSTLVRATPATRKRDLMREMYFPGPDFVPKTYEGRITVFRVRRQPRSRIRDPHLGWSRLAKGGVDVHFIPGNHTNLLKEPHVQGLAAELKKCLLQQSEQASVELRSESPAVELMEVG